MFFNHTIKIVIILLLISSLLLPAPFNSTPKVFIQPDGTEFTGTQLGDEFLVLQRTIDDYTFFRDWNEGWYYYAQQNNKKELVISSFRVGIDNPGANSIPALLDYSGSVYQEADSLREAFNTAVEKNRETWVGERTIGVVLIEFQDISGDPVFSLQDLNNLYNATGPFTTPYNSDKGGINAYILENSYGNANITATIINDEDPENPGFPDWYTASNEKYYYQDNVGIWDEVYEEAGLDSANLGFDYVSCQNKLEYLV